MVERPDDDPYEETRLLADRLGLALTDRWEASAVTLEGWRPVFVYAVLRLRPTRGDELALALGVDVWAMTGLYNRGRELWRQVTYGEPRRCSECGTRIPVDARRHQTTCRPGSRCRMARKRRLDRERRAAIEAALSYR